MNTPDHLAQDDAEATRIAREIRGGLVGVTPGPWRVEQDTSLIWGGCNPDDDTTFGMGYPMAEMRRLRSYFDHQSEALPEERNAAHIARCSPDRLTILLDEFEARGREIAELRAALDKSVELQSHQAALLNQYDGGNRRGFASGQAWIDRLAECSARADRRIKPEK